LPAGLAAAEAAAREAVTAHGRAGDRAAVAPVSTPAFARCDRITFEVAYGAPAPPLPPLGGWGPSPFTVRSRHSEVVDPFRSGVPGEADECT
ncbi:MAG: hypothetical protein ACO1PW_12310, partial [Actinomycetota bacterium]